MMSMRRRISPRSKPIPRHGRSRSPAYRVNISNKSPHEFADTAHKTHGRSMIILGAGVNHWYHMDMNYRGMINLLVFCGCVGQSGGGWSHYVLVRRNCARRPAASYRWRSPLDWSRPPRQMNSTSYFLQPRQPVALRKTDRAGAAVAAGRRQQI